MKLTLEQAKEMMEQNGGSLDLYGTPITSLPDNLTVGGEVYCDNTVINPSAYRKLHDGDYAPGKYIYADGILTHVKRKRTVGNYTFYQGRIKGKNVISDGHLYAHCENLRDGIKDLQFKAAKDRGAEQYKDLSLGSTVTKDEAISMYRIITGACKAGTKQFVDSLGELKETYSIGEIIEKTRGQYGSQSFENFFKQG